MPDADVVLITGASMGLGRAMAALLAADGWTVFGTSRTSDEYAPDGWEMVELDVTDDASVRTCVDTVMELSGRIDALVNNAGYGLRAMAEEATIDEVRAQFETNYFGVHRMNRAVLPIMREQGSGRVINISSLSGLIATPPSAHYCASKHALEGYSQAMRLEVAKFGIRVVLVEPGLTTSQFRANVDESDEPISAYDAMRERLMSLSDRAEEQAAPADVVAQTVRRALAARKPRLRYTCTARDWFGAHMRCWLPEGTTHWIVRKIFRI
jgi:NAD(P)-dependent dehydrogenase (short-subunit alcohol dehydrogenase family)